METLTLETAFAKFREAVATYTAHQETGTELKEREIVARRTMTEQDAEDAKAEYEVHQRGWLAVYQAENDAAKALVLMLGLTPAEKSTLKRAL